MNPANPIYSAAKRDVQTLRCCDRIYKRWRFQGQRNFRHQRPTHATHCEVCGGKLIWPANFWRQDIAAVRKEERRAAYYEQRVDWLRQGLTSKGQPFRRTPNYLLAEERLEARRQRGRAAWQRRADRLAAQGLTTRGTAPRRQVSKPSALDHAWRALRASVERAPATNWEVIPAPLER